ncbi:MAG TPA: hypothetical protein VMX55_05085 [candidate division Zixibacteria bacterium]|nr:hypothetical protein [candidate division Zixibacteria bacterium]
MDSITTEKKKHRTQRLISFSKALGIGLVQGAIGSGIGILLLLINLWSLFGVLVIWLIFGWFTSYLIKINSLEIIVTIVSASVISLFIYWIAKLELWFIPIIVGLSLLFWMISFTTKIFLFPPKNLKKAEDIDSHG